MALHEAIVFYNPTDTHFVGKWDGESYQIPAKSSIHIPRFIAENFAKHLINKILQDKFNLICEEHIGVGKLFKNCKKCVEKHAKLKTVMTCPERAELYKLMVIEEDIKK